MRARIALSAVATALLLGLFGLQLGTQHGPILKSYASTSTFHTPCSEEPEVCPPLEKIYSPGEKPCKTKQVNYTDVEWRNYFNRWDGLCDKTCDCTKTVHYSRWYAFNTDFPCGDHVPLCPASANTSSAAFAEAALSAEAGCFPVPVPDMAGAGIKLAARGNKLNRLQNFTLSDATCSFVDVAGSNFCKLLRNMPAFEMPALFSALVSAQVLHTSAVRALSSNLNMFATTALLAALTPNATDAESAYVRQYLNWHTSRVIGQAYSEVKVGDEFPWRKHASTSGLAKPLLLPLRVQKSLSSRCSGPCNITEFLGSDKYDVWHFDMFDFASYTCRPTQCVTLKPGTWFDIVTNVLALFGSLVNTIMSLGLHLTWAFLCWYFFSTSRSANAGAAMPTMPTTPRRRARIAPEPYAGFEAMQVLSPAFCGCSHPLLSTKTASFCNKCCNLQKVR